MGKVYTKMNFPLSTIVSLCQSEEKEQGKKSYNYYMNPSFTRSMMQRKKEQYTLELKR